MKTKPEKPILFISKVPWEKNWLMRLVIPGVDNRHAVYLESHFDYSRRRMRELRKRVGKALKNAVRVDLEEV